MTSIKNISKNIFYYKRTSANEMPRIIYSHFLSCWVFNTSFNKCVLVCSMFSVQCIKNKIYFELSQSLLCRYDYFNMYNVQNENRLIIINHIRKCNFVKLICNKNQNANTLDVSSRNIVNWASARPTTKHVITANEMVIKCFKLCSKYSWNSLKASKTSKGCNSRNNLIYVILLHFGIGYFSSPFIQISNARSFTFSKFKTENFPCIFINDKMRRNSSYYY